MAGAEARAFVPGHVTGFFTVHERETPAATGSRGAGIALSAGVTVAVRRGERSLRLRDDLVEMESVDRVLDALGVDARVAAETELPVGAGFGVSGAVSLGTALAANAAFDLRRSENELVSIAHAAEVEAGTGLGDVVAQARGGVPIRIDPGGPRHNRLDGVPSRGRLEYLSLGRLSTQTVLSGETDGISDAGERALRRLRAEPTLGRFVSVSRRFAEETDLLTPPVREAIEAVEAEGASATMAMLGETVVAPGTGLSDAGYDPEICAIDGAGATLLDP